MNCKEMDELLTSYLDHELDPVRSLVVEQHLKNCEMDSRKYKAQLALKNQVGESALYHRAPMALQERVRASLHPMEAKERKSFAVRWQWLAYAASFTFVFLLGWMMGGSQPYGFSDASVREEIISSHVRSLMPGHLTDVLSSDQHTVKPWFSGKLDFSPPVKDFASQGFPLIGGRIDYVSHKNIAVLVYGRHKHIINLFLWSSPDTSNKEPSATTLQGYDIIEWVDSGVVYYAVSDLNETELRDFLSLLPVTGQGLRNSRR